MSDTSGPASTEAGPVRGCSYVRMPDGREGFVTLIEQWRGERGADIAIPGVIARAWCPVAELVVIPLPEHLRVD